MAFGWGVLTLRVLDALEHVGPMTTADMREHLGLARDPGGSLMSRLKSSGRVHVEEWRREHDGARRYPRAVWAFGPGRNAPKPPPIPRADLERKRLRCAQAAMSVSYPGISQRAASRMRARLATLQPSLRQGR